MLSLNRIQRTDLMAYGWLSVEYGSSHLFSIVALEQKFQNKKSLIHHPVTHC